MLIPDIETKSNILIFIFLKFDRDVFLNVSGCWTNRIVIHSMAALRHISNNKFIDFLTLRNLWDL